MQEKNIALNDANRLSRENLGKLANLAERRRLFLGAANESAAARGNDPTFALDRLSRYEHVLWRQARQIVFTL